MFGKVLVVTGRIMNIQLFTGPADLAVSRRRQRSNSPNEVSPDRAQSGSMSDKGLVICRELANPRLTGLEKRVARSHRALVGAKCRTVTSINLRGQEIEVAPAQIRAAAHEVDVGVGKGNDP